MKDLHISAKKNHQKKEDLILQSILYKREQP